MIKKIRCKRRLGFRHVDAWIILDDDKFIGIAHKNKFYGDPICWFWTSSVGYPTNFFGSEKTLKECLDGLMDAYNEY